MLSYRHAYHAGNHADLLKHYLLSRVLTYYNQKNKPYDYIDTHAGAGLYSLDSAEAQKNQEYQSGIARLLAAPTLPADLENWRTQLQQHTPANSYMGSAWLAAHLLPPHSKLHLYELHPSDYEHLQQNLRPLQLGRRLQIKQTDGFSGLVALLPPEKRRAVILIDPPYEQKSDYQTVLTTLEAAYKRFANGCYLIWYPCLSREESKHFPRQLSHRYTNSYLRAELHIHPAHNDWGMHGSGIFIINPPYSLAAELNTTLPALQKLCAADEGSIVLEANIP